MSSMYHQDLLDEAKHPRRYGLLDNPDQHFVGSNSSCGDSVEITVNIDESGKIIDIGWIGKGCIMSQASMSVLAEWAVGKRVTEVSKLSQDQVLEKIGLEAISPGRIKCVMLGVSALKMSKSNPSKLY
ncbi:MAG: iron-sulfur cluster assembly scaffold protein [Microgenomates group bacterium]